ncbi:MAG: tRNA preQ1(34) S-adenosylmethionine ribosyltransferase-isomerase QueA [Lachnospiraceae bacterium]|nr:tRNA preQ1(34) S-adenosylmethionine ribosyltransferase-isomerase QueA [Lachnospiraceae bacterium]
MTESFEAGRTELLKKSDFYYDLPEELIAQDPLEKRDDSRLLVLDKDTGEVRHDIFHNITDYLHAGDLLVLNDTKVIPARLLGIKTDTGASAEILLLRRHGNEPSDNTLQPTHNIENYSERSVIGKDGDIWECIVRPGKKLRSGARVSFGDGRLEAEIIEVLPDGNRLVRFYYGGIWEEVLDSLGEMPLPPYITHKLKDRDRYQTVYAMHEGSAAAPTAGLHFTKELMSSIEAMGVGITYVTLHVGLGTFRPVKEENILDHHMHTEWYEVSMETASRINEVHESRSGRVICVGTTSCRTIESAADNEGRIKAGRGETDIFIYPGYTFKATDALITNFHLPESTLIMLVCALGGYDNVMKAYKEAVAQKYRFFSFGDAMFIK